MNWKKTKHPSDQVIAEYDYVEGLKAGGCVMHYRNLEGIGETYLAFDVNGDQVMGIVARRCQTCHSEHPTNPSFPEPPVGVKLDTRDRLLAMAPRVQVRAIDTRTMPLGNLTGMTDAERDTLAAWLAAQRTSH